ncbi:MAG TPA: hypothetical protein VN634_21560 [Candidatus Limnocylindrales bacterium]|nr:hypothetical protein [Candidatus Limnocylindrales bacterium]
MRHQSVTTMLAVMAVTAIAPFATTSAVASTVGGGGSAATDCALVLEVPGANKPALPKTPKAVDCIDGDATCDDDGLRNGTCAFSVQVCVNSTALDSCTGDSADNIAIDHSVDNGDDPRFDTDFQALQARATAIVPTSQPDRCALSSTITVPLIGPDSSNVMKKNRKQLRITTYGTTAVGDVRDVDKVKFTCRPEGDAVYVPTDLYTGTFDRIRTQIFAQTCAVAQCHDSETHQGNLILLSGAAYGNLINVVPDMDGAANDGLYRVTPGDPDMSFLYRKLTNVLDADYGASMPYLEGPIDDSLIELVRLWIIGDGTLGPAPEEGWVTGTDQ